MDIEKLNKYVNDLHRTVPGWLSQMDMMLMGCMGVAQERLSIKGDICEIGVYNGKSLVLLSMLLGGAEKAHGIDLFDDDTLPQTQEHVNRLSPRARGVVLHKRNTLDLGATDLDQMFAPGASLRYVHIDGGHEFFEVLHDLLMFTGRLRDDGILLIDDVHDREYPGINLALEYFCTLGNREQGFVPLMIGHNKMFLCRAKWAQTYQAALLSVPPLGESLRITRAAGQGVLVPFSKFPMPPADLQKAIENPVPLDFSEATTPEDLKELARAHGTAEVNRAIRRSGRTLKDFL